MAQTPYTEGNVATDQSGSAAAETSRNLANASKATARALQKSPAGGQHLTGRGLRLT